MERLPCCVVVVLLRLKLEKVRRGGISALAAGALFISAFLAFVEIRRALVKAFVCLISDFFDVFSSSEEESEEDELLELLLSLLELRERGFFFLDFESLVEN